MDECPNCAAMMAKLAAMASALDRLTDAVVSRAPAPFDGALTVSDIWEDYCKTFAGESWEASVTHLMKAPLTHFGARRISDLRRGDWAHYRDNVRKKQITRLGATPSVGTRNLELVRVKAMLAWAATQEKIPASPFAGIKPERGRPPRETVIADGDLEALLSKSGPLLRAFILVAIDSGMRKSEVLGLRWQQVEDSGRVRVSWTVAKTNRSRSVRLSERALDALDELPRFAFAPYIFVNEKTALPWSDSYMWSLFRSAVADAGLQAAEGDGNVHYHDTRHSYVTKTMQNGTPMAVAMRAAGHVTLQQAGRYMHVDETDLDIMKATNDKAIAEGPRKNPQRIGALTRRQRKTTQGQ